VERVFNPQASEGNQVTSNQGEKARAAAESQVAGSVVMIGQYQAVAHCDARELLGDERYARLLKDPLRKGGPQAGYVYPWNVADFIQFPDLGAKPVDGSTIVCPSCNGEKTRMGMFPKYADHVPQEDRKPFVFFPCDRCGATGSVPAVMVEWIAAGEKLVKQRRESGMGLREFCVANRLDVLVRSRRERGCIDPATPDKPFDWEAP
jgi:hypothetical protein